MAISSTLKGSFSPSSFPQWGWAWGQTFISVVFTMTLRTEIGLTGPVNPVYEVANQSLPAHLARQWHHEPHLPGPWRRRRRRWAAGPSAAWRGTRPWCTAAPTAARSWWAAGRCRPAPATDTATSWLRRQDTPRRELAAFPLSRREPNRATYAFRSPGSECKKLGISPLRVTGRAGKSTLISLTTTPQHMPVKVYSNVYVARGNLMGGITGFVTGYIWTDGAAVEKQNI